MSLKPTKKTDLRKKWLTGRESRSKRIMLNPEYHLIVTEGTDTEPNYFDAIKTEINMTYRDKISFQIEGIGNNTVNLFNIAKSIAEKSPNVFKHVWVVYDTDSFPPEDINQTAELCLENSTEKTTYHALWSNQCIELWYLMHFEYYHSDIHRDEYWSKLSKHMNRMNVGDYKKNRKDMYEILKPHMKNALKNAHRLADMNEGKTPAKSAPGTKMYEIIDILIPYLKQ